VIEQRRSSSSRPALATLLVLLSFGVSTGAAATAGPVRFDGGDVRLTAGEGPEMRFPLVLPSSGGHSARSHSSFAGETRVLYDLRETPGGARFEVAQDNSGDTSSAFTITFTTATELHFRFFAEPRPYTFSARFDDFLADAFYDPSGDSPSHVYRGTLVHIDGLSGLPDGFEGRLFEGELEPGTHTLAVRSSGGVDRLTVIDGGGTARLVLESAAGPVPGPTPVPLPAGAVPALVTLLATAAFYRAVSRRRRR
jgi:hypothetical protein